MYYSIAVPDDYGKACIGRAEGKFDSSGATPTIHWKDAGAPVVCSNRTQVASGGPHAIDPSVSVDPSGQWWLSYGSWSAQDVGAAGGGVWVVPLDSTTGMLARTVRDRCPGYTGAQQYPTPFCWHKNNTVFVNIANDPCVVGTGQCPSKYDGTNSIEASYLYRKGSEYYLFVNYYWCCRGSDSTYEIRMGRSKAGAAGPFVDREGREMSVGGDTPLVKSTKSRTGVKLAGPGHAGIVYDAVSDSYGFTFDYQGIGSDIEFAPQFREMTWDADGWPKVSDASWFPKQVKLKALEF